MMGSLVKRARVLNLLLFCFSVVLVSVTIWNNNLRPSPPLITVAGNNIVRQDTTPFSIPPCVRTENATLPMVPTSARVENTSQSTITASPSSATTAVPNPSPQQDCIPSQPVCENKTLPELVFVAGIEGSGHHLMSALFASAWPEPVSPSTRPPAGRPTAYTRPPLRRLNTTLGLSQPKLTVKVLPARSPYQLLPKFIPSIHLMDPSDITSASHMGFAIIHRDLFRMRLKPVLDHLVKDQKEGRRGMLLYAHSFPMGFGGILSTARPDLLMLKHYDCKLYRLKILVMRRHPLQSVLSTVRRFGKMRFKGIDPKVYTPDLIRALPPTEYPYVMQARISEDQLIYLDQQLRRFACHQVHFMDMDDIYSPSRKQKALNNLALWLGLSDEEAKILYRASLRLKPPQTRVPLPPECTNCTQRVLYDFFEERKLMWPLMST